MMFAIICDKYGDKVDTPQWMMSLFKTAVQNHWFCLATKDTRQRDIKLDPEDDIVYPPTGIAGIMGAASEALQTVLITINSAPSEMLKLLLPETPIPDKMLNRRWRRLLDLPPDSYPASELRRRIKGEEAPAPRISMNKWDEETKEYVQLLRSIDVPMWAIVKLLSLTD
jgi:hypothetical protein